MKNNRFTIEDFLDYCPMQYEGELSTLNQEILLQFIHDLDFIQRSIWQKEINKNEIFILINQDNRIDIKELLQSYNNNRGCTFELRFLLNHMLECRSRNTMFAFIVASEIHVNFFKLLNENTKIDIHQLSDELLINYPTYPLSPHNRELRRIMNELDFLKDHHSYKLFQTLTF